MNIFEPAWSLLEKKVIEEDMLRPNKIKEEYLDAVKSVCIFASDLTKTIRDVFPLYTLHDEQHIRNVTYHMMNLLGEQGKQEISRDELALLIMSAYCHDIGMSCSSKERKEILISDAYKRFCQESDIDDEDERFRVYIRIHHASRTEDVLSFMDWPTILNGLIEEEDLIRVCRSHGENIESLRQLEFDAKGKIDFRLCAVLLRLADILDFDATRAPLALYQYSFTRKETDSAEFSEKEWRKHLSSVGFDTENATNTIKYSAYCSDPLIEKNIRNYLDWVEVELNGCGSILSNLSGRWNRFHVPCRVDRSQIHTENYISGEFVFTINQSQIFRLLSGINLYKEDNVFIRELYQNAVDAVNTRKLLDTTLPTNWKPNIHFTLWEDGVYKWFQVEDNGIGMNQYIIENFLLKIGVSYYKSKEFLDELDKYPDRRFVPISAYGIGILSCFSEDDTIIEISTLRYGNDEHPLRMSLCGLDGFYYLSDKSKHHKGKSMPDGTDAYRREPGTTIAVRLRRDIAIEDLNQFIAMPSINTEVNNGILFPTEDQLILRAHVEEKKGGIVTIDKYFRHNEVSGFVVFSDEILDEEINKIALRKKLNFIHNGIRIASPVIGFMVPKCSGVIFVHGNLPLDTNLARSNGLDMLPIRLKIGLTIVGRHLRNSGYENPFFNLFSLKFPSMEELCQELDALDMYDIIKYPVADTKGVFYPALLHRVVENKEQVMVRFSFESGEYPVIVRATPDMTWIQLAALSREIDVYESCYDYYEAGDNYRGKEQYLIGKRSTAKITNDDLLNAMLDSVPKALADDFFVYRYTEYDRRRIVINRDHTLAIRMVEHWKEMENKIHPILQRIIDEGFYDERLEAELREVLGA